MPSQAKHASEAQVSSWKKRILALAAAAALVCAAVLAVQAYTVRSLQADNVLTFGNVKIRLLETTLENGQEAPVANGYADRVDADTGASRIVRVQNAGDAACWVRVRLDMEAGAEGARQDAASAVDYRYGAGVDTSDAGAQAPDALPADTWVFRADADGAGGWFYYTTPLDAAGTTAELIEALAFDTDALAALGIPDDSTFYLDIRAQAVQADNNEDNVLDAAGWPPSQTA